MKTNARERENSERKRAELEFKRATWSVLWVVRVKKSFFFWEIRCFSLSLPYAPSFPFSYEFYISTFSLHMSLEIDCWFVLSISYIISLFCIYFAKICIWCIVWIAMYLFLLFFFDVFGSVGNEVLHNLYCRIKDSRHDELCNMCGMNKKQMQLLFLLFHGGEREREQKRVFFLFPPMQMLNT